MDQQRVVDVCRDTLRVDLSLDDDLPDLGLQSMLAVKLAVRLREDFGFDVPLETFLGGSVRDVVEAVASARSIDTPR
jgi:acyl carrier protein